MQTQMKDGDSIHPHGMQRLAIRLLNVCLPCDAFMPITLCFVATLP